MRELIERLPQNVRFQLELFRKDYSNETIPHETTRAAVSAYAKGLRDAGLITDHERGMLCVYCNTIGSVSLTAKHGIQRREERMDTLREIAHQMEGMARVYGRRQDIEITFDCLTDESITGFTDWERIQKALIPGDEYFFVWETPAPDSTEPHHLLYAVNVSMDSYLTAIYELTSLLFKKF